jgi:hypothetical protein
MEIGSANYEKNGGKRREFFKIKDGEQIYRILPPLGSMAKSGRWSKYMSVEWGYADSTGKKKPFLNIRQVNRKTNMVEVESEAHLKREELKKQQVAAVAAFKAGKITKDQLDQLNKIVMNFSLENKHYVNAIDGSGKIGILKIGHKLKLAIDDLIKAQMEKGVDPLSVDNGRFFVITRSGRGLDTTFSVSIRAEKIIHAELGEVFKPIVHKLDQATIDRLKTEAMDLGDLDKLYPTLTEEEVKRVVRGTPADVTAVFAQFAKQAEAAPAVEDGPENEEYSGTVNNSAASTQQQAQSQQLDQAVGQNNAQNSTASTETQANLNQTSTPAQEAKSSVQLSDDDFLAGLASLGIKS